MAQSAIALRVSAARQVLGIPTAPCGGLFPLTPALSLGERVNPARRGEQSRFLGFPLRDARCSLSPGERVRVGGGANEALAYRTFPGTVEPLEFPFWSLFRHSSFVIRHFVYSRHETFQPGYSPGTRIRSSAALRPAQACEVSRCGAQIPALGTGGLRADAAWHGVVSVESATGEHLRLRGLQESHVDRLRRGRRGDLHLRARFPGRAGAGDRFSPARQADGGHGALGRDRMAAGDCHLGLPADHRRNVVHGLTMAPARFADLGDGDGQPDSHRLRNAAGLRPFRGYPGADRVPRRRTKITGSGSGGAGSRPLKKYGRDVSHASGKILVIRGGAIGDFILTLPALVALRQQFPNARLEVLGYPHIAQLALAGGLAADVKSIEARALAGFFARDGQLDESLANYFSGFALIVSYLYDPDDIFQSNVRRCSAAQFIVGPHRPDERLALHATEVFLKPLERLAIYDADPV